MTGIIYLITNQLNNKKYVGKTYRTLHRRKLDHIAESKRECSKHRPLYRAFNKYGVENFKFETLHFTVEEDLEKMEIHYIRMFDTYRNGYNATLGGDGNRYFKHSDEEVINMYKELKQVKLVANYFNCDTGTVRKILRSNNVVIATQGQHISKRTRIIELDLVFESVAEVSRYLVAQNICETRNASWAAVRVQNVAHKKIKSYCGLTFEFVI